MTLFFKGGNMKDIVHSATFALIALTTLLLAGCNDFVSIYPLYDDATLTLEPSLAGSWETPDDDTWTFVPSKDGKYKLTISANAKDESWDFEAGLVRLSGRLFLDLCGEDSG